jgi:hypothetical protein
MSNDELDVERHARIDMLPAAESFEWNPDPDEDAPIFRPDFNLTVSKQVATPPRCWR